MPYEDDGYDADDRPPLPAGQAHPRVAAGLEGLCSPSLKHKILPWLGAVRDGGDGESESGISDFSKGQAHSLGLESELPGAKSARFDLPLPHDDSAAEADLPPLCPRPCSPVAPAETSRSVHSAPLLSRIVADPVHSPPSLRPAGLGSPIKFPVLPQTPARRVVSTSAGTHDDGRLHGQTTGNGGAYDGATPPSGTIPSAFFIPVSVTSHPALRESVLTVSTSQQSLGSPVPVKSSTPSDESIKHSQARIRSHSGSKAPNVGLPRRAGFSKLYDPDARPPALSPFAGRPGRRLGLGYDRHVLRQPAPLHADAAAAEPQAHDGRARDPSDGAQHGARGLDDRVGGRAAADVVRAVRQVGRGSCEQGQAWSGRGGELPATGPARLARTG